jgi:cell division transport system permease protein
VSNEPKPNRSRLLTSYFTSVISISLVLFMLGLVGLLILNTRKISDYVKENIGFSVILKEDVKDPETRRLQKTLDARPYVKSTEYITKEKAAEDLQQELGEDFIGFLGYNPLLASIDVRMYAAYANPDSIAIIKRQILKLPEVKEVLYQESLVQAINENVRKISLVISGFSGILFLIALALINNTIRLSVYSRRFIINTMQLVGATDGFIRRPFLIKSSLHGVYAGLLASALIMLVVYYVQGQVEEIISLHDIRILGLLVLAVISLGILLSLVSTFFAISRYLRMKIDDLYN